MKSFVFRALLFGTGAALVYGNAQTTREVLDKYCVTCHNQKLKTGGLILESADVSQVPAHADLWEKVVQRLRARTMPPSGSKRPDTTAYNETASWLEGQLDQAEAAHPYAGRPVLHRLNRAEYANAIRDMLNLQVDVSALLPPDDAAYGFDNISEALGVSPALQERYLDAALKIAALAVGDPKMPAASQTWKIRQDVSQDKHIDDTPLGTVGGTAVRYNFPLDGLYKFQAKLYRTNLNIMRGLQSPRQMEFSIDGKRIHLANFGGAADLTAMFDKPTDTGDAVDARLQVEVPVTAGPHTVAVAFLQDSQPFEPVRLQPFIRSSVDNFDWAGQPHLQVVTITGPFKATGAGSTPSRKRIFTCKPGAQTTEAACARKIVSELVRRAYRTTAATDLDRVMVFYTKGRTGGSFESGIQSALERILASPKFVFRPEREPAGVAPGSVYRVGDVELASRLSFFLWSTIPDDRLLTLAGQGKLKDSAVLAAEVKRMLADPKANALIDNFAAQWLQLRNLRNFQPNTDIFPDFDDNLRQGFRKETELLFKSVMDEDRPVLDLMTADYTFVNERLAEHYGIPGIYGERFRRVPVTDEARKGLLGQGSILALTSHAERTSPVVRGKWVLENLMGLTVPPPPPDVPPLPEKKDGDKPKTMREQMAEHRANPVCAACHKTLDPIGFAMENFDATGAWRTKEAGGPIDASGELVDGTKVDGVVALRKALLSQPEMFVSTVAKKLMTYGLGRGLDYRDMPEVRAVVKKSAANNYKFSELIVGVVNSTPFRMSTAAEKQEIARQ